MTSYVKLIRKDHIHRGLLLHEGLNCLKPGEEFDESPTCVTVGLYFCKEEDFLHWLPLYKDDLGYIAQVTLCPDSRVVAMDKKLKTDKFMLGPFQAIDEYFTSEKIFAVVQKRGMMLPYIPRRFITLELCMAAAQKPGWRRVLPFVPREFLTPEFCLTIVQHDTWLLGYIPIEILTPELCLTAVQQNGMSLQFVPIKFRTPEICMAAVQQNGDAILSVPDKQYTLNIRLASLLQICCSRNRPASYWKGWMRCSRRRLIQ